MLASTDAREKPNSSKVAGLMKANLKPSTIKTYSVAVERLIKNGVQKRKISPEDHVEMTPDMMVNDWHETLGKVASNTAIMTRSALIWRLQTDQAPGWENAQARLLSLSNKDIKAMASGHSRAAKNARPAGRMIPEEDFISLIKQLGGMGETGARAQWFLMSTVASGARPVEWIQAEWADQEQGVLRLYGAKVKKRAAWSRIPALTFVQEDDEDEVAQLWRPARSRGSDAPSHHDVDFERRLAGLSGLEDEEIQILRESRIGCEMKLFRDVQIEPQYRMVVDTHITNMKSVLFAPTLDGQGREMRVSPEDADALEEVFKTRYYNPARVCIWRACQAIFPDKRYALADARSANSANQKALLGIAGAAQKLGHGPSVARNYYAPQSKAWSRFKDAAKNAEQNGHKPMLNEALMTAKSIMAVVDEREGIAAA